MKFSLKNVNWKRVGIDHGEKIVLAVVALLVLLILVSAPWATETRDPEKLVTNVSESQAKVHASTWPDAERAKYATQSGIGEQVGKLMTAVDVTKFWYKTDMIWPLVRREEPIREPEFLPVDSLQATSGRTTIEMQRNPAGATEGQLADAGTAKPKAEETSDEFEIRNRSRSSEGIPGRAGGAGIAAPPAQDVLGAGNGSPGSDGGVYGKGVRFAAVTGVVPYRRQADRFAKARHEPISRSYDALEYLDFQLERKTAVAGADPWSGPWEPVNVKLAMEVVRDADFEDDVVEASITNPVVTMPLPRRVQGSWDAWANHPLLANFALSDEGKELQRLMTEQLIEFERQTQLAESKQGPRPGGFAAFQRDVRRLQQNVANSADNSRQFNQFLQDPNVNAVDRARNEKVKKKVEVTAAGQYLLFRYFDFDVAPNNAYRYRVRLVVANPNYGLSPDQVVVPFVAEKETRETPWSNETDPVVIGDDVQFFLTKLDSKYEVQRGLKYTAQFDVFQWNAETGMPVHDDALKVVYGQQIMETTKESTVLYPPTHMKKEPFTFNTGDVLIDSTEMPLLSEAAIHSDLKLPTDSKSRLAYVEKALLVNEYGELVTIDPQSTKSHAERTKWRFEKQTEPWEKVLEDPSDSGSKGSTLDQLSEGVPDPMGIRGAEAGGGKKRSRNPTKTAVTVLGAAAGAPMPPGGAGMPPEGPKGRGKR